MSRRCLTLLSLIAASAIAQGTASAAIDRASHCQGKKLKAVGVAARDLLRCHTQAVLTGSAVSGVCVTHAEERLASAFAWADAKGGCLTVGDALQVQSGLGAGVAGIATMLRPDTSASVCTSNKFFSAARAAARLLKAFAKERKKSNEGRFSHATADFRQNLQETFAAVENASSDCRTLGDGRAVAERVLALAGDATLRLWPLARSGLTVSPPSGFSPDGILFALSNGNVLQFRNYGQSQMTPRGGADMTISRFPLPGGPLSEYVERESQGRQLLSTSSVTVGGHTATRVSYRDDYDAGISFKTTIVYVARGSSLHRFELAHGWGESAEGSFTTSFDTLLSSVTFVP